MKFKTFKSLVLFVLVFTLNSCNNSKPSEIDYSNPLTPEKYQQILWQGMDVDWSKTEEGKEFYNEQTVIDFKYEGLSHVRIRVKDEADEKLFTPLINKLMKVIIFT